VWDVGCRILAAYNSTGVSDAYDMNKYHVVTRTREYDHITPVLRDLHWLPVRQRIIFKQAMTVFKCILGLEPSYLSDDCILASSVAGRRHLRSANTRTLVLRRTKTAIGTTEFCCFLCCRMEQLTSGTSNAVLLSTNFCAKTKATPVYQLLYMSASEDFLFCATVYEFTRYYYYYY